MKRFGRSIGTYLIIFLVVIMISGMLRGMTANQNVKEIKFSQFAVHLEKGDYESVNITDRRLTGTKKDKSTEVTYAPSALEINWIEEKLIYPMLDEGKLELDSEPPKSEYTLLNLLPTMIKSGGFFSATMFWFSRKAFDKIGGFDESLVSLEDADFARRLKALGERYGKKYGTLKRGVVLTSSRKFDEFGDWYLIRNRRLTKRIFTGKDRQAADEFYYDVR